MPDELAEITKSRGKRWPTGVAASTSAAPAQSSDPLERAWDADLVGLCFSGGGIRSATFNLGVLQALAERELIGFIDYLSTVSGGGYIGSWLACWCKRSGGIQEVEDILKNSLDQDPDHEKFHPIQFLREYSNYLTPKTGFLSADWWTLVSVWTRNTLLNQIVLVSAVCGLLLALRIGVGELSLLEHSSPLGMLYVSTILSIGLLAVVAGPECGASLSWFVRFALRTQHDWGGRRLRQGSIVSFVVVPLLFASALAAYALGLWMRHDGFAAMPDTDAAWWAAGASFLVFAAILGMIAWRGRYGAAGMGFSLLAAVLGALCVRVYCGIVGDWSGPDWIWRTLTFGTAAVLLIFTLTYVLNIGLLGAPFPDERREWWARLGAWLILASIGWLALFVATAWGPRWLLSSLDHNSYGAFVSSLTGAGWIGTTIKGVLAAKRPDTGKQSASEGPLASRWEDLFATVAPYIFVAGLVIALSVGLQWVVARLDQGSWLSIHRMSQDYSMGLDASREVLLLVWGGAVGIMIVFGWRVDVNEFSLHHFYRNRLVRCYFGASREQKGRHANPFTGFDPYDDPKLARFRVDDVVKSSQPGMEEDLLDAGAKGKPYVGPFPILNTTLNLAAGDDLAWQERKAESFVFTPLYCGFQVEPQSPAVRLPADIVPGLYGFRRTIQYAYDRGPSLGTAMAISGAAANPNMGYHTSPAVAVLMTFFDVRLGWWMGNPRNRDTWTRSGPSWGLGYLIQELMRETTDRADFVNLSDGGHFENLGIYELVRRRCRLIIACDSEEDSNLTFGGLGNAIRKCRTDFGVEIRIDLDLIRRKPGEKYSGEHFAIGTIQYPGCQERGLLVYLKSSLTGKESSDVLEYASREPTFPHQSTADQWFDESQFESYRKLGYEVASDFLSRFGSGKEGSDLVQAIQNLAWVQPEA